MMVWSADEVHLTDDDVHVGIGATAGEFLASAVSSPPAVGHVDTGKPTGPGVCGNRGDS
jgi:hypothetical protein